MRNTIKARDAVERADLAAVAQWAGKSTESTAAFRFDSEAVPILARRSLVFTWKDIDTVASDRPDRAAVWAERRRILRQAGSNPAALWEAGVRFGADYVLVSAGKPLERAPAARVQYENLTYVVLATDRARADTGTVGKATGAT